MAGATPANGSGGVSVSAALERWREIDLPAIQSSIGDLQQQLIASQKESLVSRKRLADSTREFKKQPDEAKLEGIKSLLKAYQIEIDTLTKRAQSSENAFLKIWDGPSGIKGAPDPYPMLEILVEQAVAIAEAESLRARFDALQQSYDALVRKTETLSNAESERYSLQNRLLASETSFEERLRDRTQSLEKEWEAKLEERSRNSKDKERETADEIARLKEQVKELRTREDDLTRKGLSGSDTDDGIGRSADGSASAQAEVEMMVAELERANRRTAELELRNVTLRAEIEGVRSGKEASARARELEQETRGLKDENKHLKSLIGSWEASQKKATDAEGARRQEHEKQLAAREKEIASYRAKLERQQDYEEIKREVEILRTIEFGGVNLDEAAEEEGTENIASTSLEASLLQKNRRLQDEVATLRVQFKGADAASKLASEELKSVKAELARAKSLNERLENDLVSVNGPPDIIKEKAGVSSASNGRETPQGYRLPGTREEGASADASAQASKEPSSDSSLLTIVTSQRDRFRTRNAELEGELRRQAQTISELRTEAKSLQADNLGLYEKVRYLQTYGAEAGPSNSKGHSGITIRTEASGAYPPPSGANFTERREDRYRRKYEERMDPFQAFRGKVSG